MTTAQEAGTPTTSSEATKRERPDPPPVTTDALLAERDLLHLGRLAREVLEAAKMPRHFWFENFAHELVVGALGRFSVERKRVLRQRSQLRQLHAKVLQLKGEILQNRTVQASMQATIKEKQELIEQLRRNR
jgi:hypothetical protein